MNTPDLEKLCLLWQQCFVSYLDSLSAQPYECVAIEEPAADIGETVDLYFGGDCRLGLRIEPGPSSRLLLAQIESGAELDPQAVFSPDAEQAWFRLLNRVTDAWIQATGRTLQLELHKQVSVPQGAGPAHTLVPFELRRGGVTLPMCIRLSAWQPQDHTGEVQQPDHDRPHRVDIPAPQNVDLLLDVELQATLRFGTREMLLGEVLDLCQGDVLPLDRPVHAPVELVVGDRIVALGDVVIVDGNYGLRVTQLVAPQQRLESIRCLF